MMNKEKLVGVVALSRFFEVYDFALLTSVFGALLSGGGIGLRLVLICIANFFSSTFAFMINDVEDAPEDSLDARKRERNPISKGVLTRKEGALLSAAVLGISLLLYGTLSVALNKPVLFAIASFTLLVQFLYSWRAVRLKAVPVLDLLSHMYMLSTAQYLLSFLTFAQEISGMPLIAFFSLMCLSGVGELHNEIGDFDTDKKTGIRTTATLVGQRPASSLLWLLLATGLVSMGTVILWALPLLLNAPALSVLILALLLGMALSFQKKQRLRSRITRPGSNRTTARPRK